MHFTGVFLSLLNMTFPHVFSFSQLFCPFSVHKQGVSTFFSFSFQQLFSLFSQIRTTFPHFFLFSVIVFSLFSNKQDASIFFLFSTIVLSLFRKFCNSTSAKQNNIYMGHSQNSCILLLFVSFAYIHDEIPIETVI